MTPRSLTLSAWGITLVAFAIWGGYGVMIWQLSEARTRIVEQDAALRIEEERDRSSSQLQSLLRETRDERAALETFLRADALAAAATIEAVGKRAGVTLSIEGATQVSLEGAGSADVRAITISANGEGEFSSIMRAAALLETLPFPSRVESYELSSLTPTKAFKDPWLLSARIRVLIPADASL